MGAALLAPIVSEWCRYRIIDRHGEEIGLSELFESIGNIVREFEMRYLAELLSVRYGEAWVAKYTKMSSSPTAWSGDVPAFDYVNALSQGDARTADNIALTTDTTELKCALRLIALSTSFESSVEKAAVAGIGRLAMQSRGELPGSFPKNKHTCQAIRIAGHDGWIG